MQFWQRIQKSVGFSDIRKLLSEDERQYSNAPYTLTYSNLQATKRRLQIVAHGLQNQGTGLLIPHC